MDLGTLGGWDSAGYGINDNGQVTGGANIGSSADFVDFHAFLYDHGTMYDLNNLVTNLASAGFSSLETGYGINNHGQIVGVGYTTNGYDFEQAFLATPNIPTPSVPLPSSAALLSLGLVALGVMGQHRPRGQI